MIRQSARYRDIQDCVQRRHGFRPQTYWIAHVKELCGLPVRRAPNRSSDDRAKTCPPDKQEAIKEAFRHFGMLP